MIKSGNRNTVIGLDKIVQRSSSKSVKQALLHLDMLCENDQQTAAPWKELDMLLELSTDVYYRVVMKKCRGFEIIQRVQENFPQLIESCDQLLKALSIPGESEPSPRSTRTAVILDPIKKNPVIDSMQVDSDDFTRSSRSDTSEDIVQIINEGCQKILW